LIETQKPSIAFVELQPSLPNIGSFVICPSYGLVVLATIVRNLKYQVIVYLEGMTEFSITDLSKYDIICFTTASASANKTYQMADELRKNGKIVIFGGTHATYFAEDCLAHCDYVIHREGDDILPALLMAIAEKIDVSNIKGISYLKNGSIKYTGDPAPPTNLNTAADFSLLKDMSLWGPRKRIFAAKRVMLPVQSSRGCPNNCSYCIVSKMFSSCYRKRPVDSVIEEIKSALRYTHTIHFVDNNFVGSTDYDVAHTQKLLKAIIDNDLKIKGSVFVTIDIANKPELLKLMRKAGLEVLMIGFESLDEQSLASYHKSQKVGDMEKNIGIIKGEGFTVLGSFMVGSNGEDAKKVLQTSDTAHRWGIDQLYYLILSPYPEMAEIVSPDRVFLNNWDYATGNHIYFFPQNTPPSQLQEAVLKATSNFYSHKQWLLLVLRGKFKEAKERLLRHILFNRIEVGIKPYMPFLREIESNFYRNGKYVGDEAQHRKIEKLKVWSIS
jgi:radical SAM superfamily enzyme YgiQ (UPF0313 family)